MKGKKKDKEKRRRRFRSSEKEACWQKASPVPGRDPERWRYDATGYPVLRKLAGCHGCLCFEYDHKIPFSKGGETSVENCQILGTRANRRKGNHVQEDIRRYQCKREFSVREMDVLEMAVYGEVKRKGLHCRVPSFMEREGIKIPVCPPPPLEDKEMEGLYWFQRVWKCVNRA